jgi:hypothetical protein
MRWILWSGVRGRYDTEETISDNFNCKIKTTGRRLLAEPALSVGLFDVAFAWATDPFNGISRDVSPGS